jgi:antitoxin HicB
VKKGPEEEFLICEDKKRDGMNYDCHRSQRIPFTLRGGCRFVNVQTRSNSKKCFSLWKHYKKRTIVDSRNSRRFCMICKLPLVLTPQPEGGYIITSPLLPELVTEGDTIEEALENVRDALLATIEAYEDMGQPLPASVQLSDISSPVWLETLVATS